MGIGRMGLKPERMLQAIGSSKGLRKEFNAGLFMAAATSMPSPRTLGDSPMARRMAAATVRQHGSANGGPSTE